MANADIFREEMLLQKSQIKVKTTMDFMSFFFLTTQKKPKKKGTNLAPQPTPHSQMTVVNASWL